VGAPPTTDEELIDTAIAQAGLDDFGGDTFREGLAQLHSSLRTEGRLNAVGEGFIYPRLVSHLVTRLQVEDWYAQHPETDDAPVLAPLIGLSLPRTGSTALSFLLAQDPDVRYLHTSESGQPVPPPSTRAESDTRDTTLYSQQIGTRDHVPADAEGPMECLDLMALDFRTMIYEAFARIPSYAAWLNEQDLTSTYAYERRVLKLLQYVGRVNLEQWSLGISRVLEFREGAGNDRFYDIDFRAVQADPIGEVRGLYEWLGQPVSDQFEQRMRRWWEANSENREPSSHSDLAHYGLDPDTVRPLFADYVGRAREWTAHPR